MKGYTWELPAEDSYPLTILGIGTTGLAVVEHLFQLAIRDVRFVICHADEMALRTSPVSTRILYDAEGDAIEADQNLRDELGPVLKATELTIIVTDLSQSIDCHLASTMVNVCAELDKFTIVAIGLPALGDQLLREQANIVLAGIQQQAHSLLVYRLDHLASEQRVYQLAEGVTNLTMFCDGFVSQDFADMRRVVTKPGRIAVTMGTGRGGERNKIALEAVTAQLNEQPFDARLAQRLVLISSSSAEKSVSVQEHGTIMKDMLSFMTHEPTIVKCGLILDNSLNDKLRLNSLFWMPVESKAVDLSY